MPDPRPTERDNPESGPPAPAIPAALRFSKRQLALAFAVAAASDALGVFATFAPPLMLALDFATALLLFAVLGRQWVLLPGLVLEAIPGVGVVPVWLMVVGAVAVWG